MNNIDSQTVVDKQRLGLALIGNMVTDCCIQTGNVWKLCWYHQLMFGLLVTMLGLSLALNIYCYSSKRKTARKRVNKEHKRSYGQRQMEENPIYGNIALQCTQTNGSEITSPNFTSSVRRDQMEDHYSQDCYANLTLKLARSECGPSVSLSGPEVEEEEEEEKEDHMEVLSIVSDLYASVQTQRAKILEEADSEMEYANHL